MEAYRIALEAIRALHFGSVRGDTTFISSTPGKIKKPESLGEPQLYRLRRLPRVGHQKALKRSLVPAGRRLRKAGFLALSMPGWILGAGLL